ncbi:venom metalloproteinase 2 isoform X2 [Microplitis demolitor]|nr:venom metalloproteinase 2 isoform X2 [Microplitis demolitor]
MTFVTQPNGSRTIHSGSIGSENLFIIPIPQSRKYQFYKFNSYDNYYYTHNDNKYQTSYAHKSPITKYPYLSNNNFYTYYQQMNTIPDTIYPEILIIIDYELLVNIGEDKIIIYLIQFWNQVDLLFRTLSNPQYKLNIAGIVIPMEPDTLQYLTDGSFSSYGRNNVDLHIALRSFKKWIYQQRYVIPIDSYDLAITMTSKVTNGNRYGFSYGEVIGRALSSSACAVDHFQQQVLKAGIIATNGDFQDVLTAAHEIGHILGATHDDAECPNSAGYIMSSAVIPGTYSTQWSQCSLRDFTNFLRTNPTCLYNKPKT